MKEGKKAGGMGESEKATKREKRGEEGRVYRNGKNC